MFDVRYQVALHTTSYKEQPLSDRSLSRFRARCLKYQKETGIDLLHNTICELSERIADLIRADRTLLRMDSVMIEANIRRLSRLELIYTSTGNALKKALKTGQELPENLRHYMKTGDFNESFYGGKATEEQVIQEAVEALTLTDETCEETKLLKRVLDEQVTEEKSLKAGSKMCSENLQSPYDPDATYRRKLHSRHVGYVGNFLESSGPNGTVILDYQYEKNVYSDSRFLRDTVFRMGYQQKPCVLVTDGGYSGAANTQFAKKHNITLITTNLTGRYRSDSYLTYRNTDQFRYYSRFRNGVEAIPSLLRRKYRIDTMPVRGKLRTGFFFGCKIGAINVRRLCSYLQGSGQCTKNEG